ncbi:hypothetical protein [Acidithiobacillus thiooxidans]|uniref:Uncharacterized protein n=1 Tax=Acidithiobacillus thiooxidans TaxID=930 RepID=A0A1C2IHU4_ACITH|nr:hypothetical protein [Acidithiobacillus thiooxidans]OCX75541.1 hypothetical protein A6M23_01990 [Acidithiobacillus thiooxidans]OCX78192.1 hypothetical protein A6P08_19955 [Acidithiobacillus thiooxidans]
MSKKTICMSKGRPVDIDFENWSTWAEATDYNDTSGRNVFQSYSSLHVYKRGDQEKYLVCGKSFSCYNGGHTTYAGILVTDEAELTGAMRQVMDDLGLVVGHGDVANDYLLREWEQDLPPVDLD